MYSQNKIRYSDGENNLASLNCNKAVIIIMVRGRIAHDRKNIKNIAHIMLKGNVGEVLDMTLRILQTMMRGDER